MLKAVKVKLYPNKEQNTTLNKLFGCYRKVYNMVLDYKIEVYKKDKTIPVGIKELGKYFHGYLTKEEQFFYLAEHNTKVLKQSIINLLAAYNNFFKSCKGERKGEKVGFPKFKSKNDKQSVRFPSEAISSNTFSGEKNNKLNLTKQLKNLTFKCSDSDKKYLLKYSDNIKSITISKSTAGTLYASILIDGSTVNEFRKRNQIKETENIIGLDLGIKSYFVSYDGKNSETLENPKFIRKNEKKLKHLQRKLSKLDDKNRGKRNNEFKEKNGREIDESVGKKAVKTNNRDKTKNKLALVYEKLNNQRDTFLHQITSKLIDENQIIIIEDLNIKGMMKNHNLAKSIQELSLGKFKTLLEYKAEWYGKDIIKIGRWFPSSKLCSCCGNKKPKLLLSERTYICEECGNEIDRDLNAAINIREEGIRIYLKENKNREPLPQI